MRSSTKESLILAALKLFSERGVHGVSLREINAAAGTKNHSAANYYFKDKNGLVAAVLDYGSRVIGPTTAQLLAEIDTRLEQGDSIHPRDVLIAGFGSNVALIQDQGFGKHYVRSISRIVFELTPDFTHVFNQAAGPLYQKMFAQLCTIEPDRDKDDIRRDTILTGTAVLHLTANLGMGSDTPLGDVSFLGKRNIVEYIFNYFSAAYVGGRPPLEPINASILAAFNDVLQRSRAISFPD